MKVTDVNARTGIAIKELNRLNSDSWFHGTTLDGAKSLQNLGIIALYNIGNMLDFGAGFYLTDTRERASSYISRVPEVTADFRTVQRMEWMVLEYEFNPYRLLFGDPESNDPNEVTAINGMNYRFKNFPKHDEEFAKFAFENRLNNLRNEHPHGIDLIWGVMSDNFPDQIMYDFQSGNLSYEDAILKLQKPNSMKQLYIGSQRICDKLVLRNVLYERREA